MFKHKIEALVAGQQVQKVKAHVLDHREAYLAGSAGLVVGVLGTKAIARPVRVEVVNNINVGP